MKASQTPPEPDFVLNGAWIYQDFLGRDAQKALVRSLRRIVALAPLFVPVTRLGKPMSVRMTSAGRFGWVSDRQGYRYSQTHPDGQAWPPIPTAILEVWQALSGTNRAPECCLINFYRDTAHMGMHQDRDEDDFSHPVVSLSLGDDALFRIGTADRGGKTVSHWLKSGDVLVLKGPSRLAFHGVDRIRPHSSRLLQAGGRINLTLRVVT